MAKRLEGRATGKIGVRLTALRQDAWRQVRAWIVCETAWIPEPTECHADLLNEFLALAGVQANLVPDRHLAAPTLRAWAHAVFHGWGFCVG